MPGGVTLHSCGTLSLSSILSPGTKKMNKENKLIPGLPPDLKIVGIKNYFSKKLLKAIEKNFIKFGAEALKPLRSK